MKRLYIFDMDGTLLVGGIANIEIAKATNTLPRLLQLESRLAEGTIDDDAFSIEIYKLWGVLDDRIIEHAFDNCVKIRNIRKVTENIAAKGDYSCIITMSPDFFANRFYPFGFNYIYASKYPIRKNQPLDLAGILKPGDKYPIAKQLCQSLGIDINHSVAFGDSRSDYLLFKNLRNTISINGTPQLRLIASHCYDGDDLMEAFERLKL